MESGDIQMSKLIRGISMPLSLIVALVAMQGCGSSNSDSNDSDQPQVDQSGPGTNAPESEPLDPNVSDAESTSCTDLSLGFNNLGAESVEPATSDDLFSVLTSWEIVTGNTSSTLYGSGGYPEANEGQGSRLFTGGNEATSMARQTVVLAANVVGCDFVFSAEVGGFAEQEDNASVEISFFGSSDEVLSTNTLGPVTPDDRQGETALLPLEATGTIPDTAVLAQITITQTRETGNANDGYLDNILVTLQ